MANAVTWFEVGVKDAQKSAAFYRELFGWTITPDAEYPHITHEEGGVGGGLFPLPPDMKPYVAFYVDVDDLQAALAQAVALGGKVGLPPKSIGENGSIAGIVDPDGNWIGLISEKKL